MAAADIYCQPNTRPEPFGITFIEALKSRLPVVGTTLGGPREIIDDSCGLLVTPGNAAQLAGALGNLIRDTELRKRLSRRRKAPATRWPCATPESQLKQLARVLLPDPMAASQQPVTFPVTV